MVCDIRNDRRMTIIVPNVNTISPAGSPPTIKNDANIKKKIILTIRVKKKMLTYFDKEAPPLN